MEKNNRKIFFVLLPFLIMLVAGRNLAYAYNPPKYIANPETKECRYYFAGDEDCFNACMNECQGTGSNQSKCYEACADPCHYNLRPAGFTVDIGKTTDFKDDKDACNQWKECLGAGGQWNSTTLKCKQKTNTLAIAGIASALILVILIYIKLRKILKK